MKKLFYFILLSLVFSTSVIFAGSTPVNYNCGNAVTIVPNTVCSTNTVTVEDASIDAGTPTCNGNTMVTEFWYKFVATATTVDIEVNIPKGADGQISAYTGTCGGTLTLLGACANVTTTTTSAQREVLNLTGLTIGVIYYYVIGTSKKTGVTQCIVSPSTAAPTNDDCANATTLTVSSVGCSYTNTTNLNATTSSTTGTPAPGCGTYSGGDVWYKFTSGATNAVHNFLTNAGGMTDGGMALYSGTCGSLTLISCNDPASGMPSITWTPPVAGTVYFLRVWENGNDNNGTFGICATSTAPVVGNCPTNLNIGTSGCTLTCGTPVNFFDSGGSGGSYTASENRTTTFTVPSGNTVRVTFTSIDMESTTYDRLRVFDGPTTGSTLVGTYGGTTLPPTFTSTGTTLTFNFTSDGSIQYTGFVATIDCIGPCSGIPTPGSVTPTTTTLCGGSVLLTAAGYTAAAGITFQWYSGPTSATATTVVTGATSPTLTVSPASTTHYRCAVICSGSTAYTATVVVNVTAPTYAPIPYLQSFEGSGGSPNWQDICGFNNNVPDNLNNWRQFPNTGDNSWRRDDDGATAGQSTWGAYTPVFTLGSHSARYHSYDTSDPNDFDLYVNLSSVVGTKTLSFDYINTSGSDFVDILLSTDAGASFSNVGTVTLASAWTNTIFCLSSNSATSIVRFHADGDFGSTDIGMDNLKILPPCAAAPTGLTTTASATLVCANNTSFTVTVEGFTCGQTFQWQSSTDNGATWTNLSGSSATTSTYSSSGISVTTIFRCVTTCPTYGSANSPNVTVTRDASVCALNYTKSTGTMGMLSATTAVTGLGDDNLADSKVPIGFTFCFDGRPYTDAFVAANAALVFDAVCGTPNVGSWTREAAYTGQSTGYTIPSNIPINNMSVPANAILAPWHDIQPSTSTGSNAVTYGTSGTAPNRVFTLYYKDIAQFSSSCTGSSTWYTAQIQLFETTNVIEVDIVNKYACDAWDAGYSTMGLHNYDGTQSVENWDRSINQDITNTSYRYTPAAACNCLILPTNLSEFTAKQKGVNNIVTWKYEDGINKVDNFYLQKSKDAIVFDEVIRVNPNAENSYTFVDRTPFDKITYYKLATIDKDTKLTYSNIISVNNSVDYSNITVSPNPAINSVDISIFSSLNCEIFIEICDIGGKLISLNKSPLIEGNNSISINTIEIVSGMYFIKIYSNDNIISNSKLSIQR